MMSEQFYKVFPILASIVFLGMLHPIRILLEYLISILWKTIFEKDSEEEKNKLKNECKRLTLILIVIWGIGITDFYITQIINAKENPGETTVITPQKNENTKAPTDIIIQGEVKDVRYYISMSHEKNIPISELLRMDKETLYYIRNGIYAYHGRRFLEDYLTSYYYQFDWYSPSIDADKFNCNVFSKIEWENIKNIEKIEKLKED